MNVHYTSNMDQQQRDLPPDEPSHQTHHRSEIEGVLSLSCIYPAVVDTTERVLQVVIKIQPRHTMPNLPVEVEIRGFSHLQRLTRPSKSQGLEITESLFFEDEERVQSKPMMKQSVYMEKGKNLQKQGEQEQKGEYFLEGCQVLYQLQELSHERLEELQAATEYTYPLEFTLPANLPESIDNRLLSAIHVTIRYSLQLKVSYFQGEKIRYHQVTLPFALKRAPKAYPFEELVVNQKIRCYHEYAKTRDRISTNKLVQLAKCMCSQCIFQLLAPNLKVYSSRFPNYDIFHVEVLAVVTKNDTLFLTVRVYKEPEEGSLTVNRKKRGQENSKGKKDQALADMPAEVSIASIKESRRQSTQVSIHKVEVQMMAEMVNVGKEVIFTKVIALSRWNYDLLQGEGMVDLKEYLDYPHSCRNQLFELRYIFSTRAIFEDEDGPTQVAFESFVVEEVEKRLDL